MKTEYQKIWCPSKKWRRLKRVSAKRKTDSYLLRKILLGALLLESAYVLNLQLPHLVTMKENLEFNVEVQQEESPKNVRSYGIYFNPKKGDLSIYRKEETLIREFNE